jgi:hypothetical protein
MSEQTEQTVTKAVSVQTVLQGVQTLVLLGSIAAVFLTIGRRDAMLDGHGDRIRELAAITSDLARTVGTLSATDREFGARIDSILLRIDRLEERKN